MSNYNAHTNSVGKEASRIIQLEVLKKVSDIVMATAGPKGSTTMIMKGNSYPLFSKDGKKVAEHIDVFGEVEKGILDQLIQIVQTVVSRVGDGTTSAIRLAYLIFVELVKMEKNDKISMNTYDIIDCFKKAVDIICKIIKSKAKELTPNSVYDICMISTNGNEELSSIIKRLYEKYGNGVYIELKTSNTTDYMIKEYDGLTLAKGYATPAYINRKNEICELKNVRLYTFKDPIDTPEMIGFFTRIVYDNILTPFNNLRMINQIKNNPQMARNIGEKKLKELEENSTMIPTLIMCPFMSRDLSTTMETLESLLYGFDKDETTRMAKPPIAIVNNLSRNLDELSDLSTLCDCKVIAKYIDESVQAKDIKDGKAPTIDNVTDFYGYAEQVIVYNDHTKFINPKNMFKTETIGDETKFVLDKDGNRVYSDTFESLVSFLNGQIAEAEKENDVVSIRMLRRRLNGLKSSLVELYIGGISVTDRESVKDLADDAIRNCRSAATCGVGRAANFEALLASCDALYDEKDELIYKFIEIINNAYISVVKELYSKSIPTNEVDKEFDRSLEKKQPINLRTGEYSNNVLASIDTDITVLDCISRIVTIMFTSNQILINSAFENRYAEITTSELWEEITKTEKSDTNFVKQPSKSDLDIVYTS